MQKYYVYLLIDPRNNEIFYVGKGQGNRMLQHKYTRNFHHNAPLADRIKSILAENQEIIYEKVLFNVNETLALNKEREIISTHGRVDLSTGPLLNLTDGGEGSSNWSKERKHQVSEREIAKKKGKDVSQYTLDGKFISHFSSAKVAGECTTANRSYITQVCKGNQRSAGGFLWTYKGEPKPTFSKEYYKAVEQFSYDGVLLNTFRSLTEAQDATGVELHNISECCRGKSKTAGGFVWNYHN